MELQNRSFEIRIDAQSKYTINDAGFLICDAALTRAGIFEYLDETTGNRIRELRPAEEVFKQESLDTAKLLPITFVHPKEMVNNENYKGVIIGIVGENITKLDGELVGAKVQIMDKQVVRYVLDCLKEGKDIQLSMGYTSEVLKRSGMHSEGAYDAVQTNIRYNHLSIVDKGRAGAHVKLRLDNKEDVRMYQHTRGAIQVGTFRMDAIALSVPDELNAQITTVLTRLDEAVEVIKSNISAMEKKDADLAALQAKFDEANASLEKVKKDLADWQNPTGEKVQGLIKDRAALEKIAASLDIKTDGVSDDDLKIAVIKAVHKDFSLEGKAPEYINARFDAVVESIELAQKADGNDALGALRKDALDGQNKGHKDPRAEFLRKSDAMSRGQDPDKVE